jgi:NTP pyrophosphatase (non-canonical NTP hydrolase)
MTETYQTLAARTVSPDFHDHLVTDRDVLGTLFEISRVADLANELKRSLFYGVPYTVGGEVAVAGEIGLSGVSEGEAVYIAPEFIHALLGFSSEAGEVADAILTSMLNHTPLDTENLKEEAGDMRWYGALLATTLFTVESDIEEANIAKLRARFPSQFTAAAATTRDLDAEKVALS